MEELEVGKERRNVTWATAEVGTLGLHRTEPVNSQQRIIDRKRDHEACGGLDKKSPIDSYP